MDQLDTLIGKFLGDRERYLIDTFLGEDKFGRVYKAIDIDTKSESDLVYIAIKFLRIDLQNIAEAKTQFQLAIQDYIRIQDEYVVPVLDYGTVRLSLQSGQVQEFPFIVMEFIEASISKLSLAFSTELCISTALQEIIGRHQPADFKPVDAISDTLELTQTEQENTNPSEPIYVTRSITTNRSGQRRSLPKNRLIAASLLTAIALLAGGLYLFMESQALKYASIVGPSENPQNQMIYTPPIPAYVLRTTPIQVREPAPLTMLSSNLSNVNVAESLVDSQVLPPSPITITPSPLAQPTTILVSDRPNIPTNTTPSFTLIPTYNLPSEPVLEIIDNDSTSATKQLKLTLDAAGSQSFTLLVKQAESLATNAIAQEFATYPQINTISIMAFGDRGGQLAPLLSATISRQQWESNSRVQPWANYMLQSEVLLGYKPPQVPKASQPSPNATTSSPASTSKPATTSTTTSTPSRSTPSFSDTESLPNLNRENPSIFKNKPDATFSDN